MYYCFYIIAQILNEFVDEMIRAILKFPYATGRCNYIYIYMIIHITSTNLQRKIDGNKHVKVLILSLDIYYTNKLVK